MEVKDEFIKLNWINLGLFKLIFPKPKYNDVIVSYLVRHDHESKGFWKCGPFFLFSPKDTLFSVYIETPPYMSKNGADHALYSMSLSESF